MKKNILIHIPHSSLKLPKCFFDNIIVSKSYIEKENIFISDYLVDLFSNEYAYVLKFNLSRLCCDVERYVFNEQEEMSKYGMGVIYEKDSSLNKFIELNENYKNYILNKYYYPHHNKLNNLVNYIIDKYDFCNIIDLHSFSDEFVYKIFKYENTPDICIGTNVYSYPKYKKLIINHFKEYGYSVLENYPYSGSIIPNTCKDYKKINSIMIEINKRIYLDDNKIINKEKYKKLSMCMNSLYKKL